MEMSDYDKGYSDATKKFTEKLKEKSLVFIAEYIIFNHILDIDDATLLALGHEIDKEIIRREP